MEKKMRTQGDRLISVINTEKQNNQDYSHRLLELIKKQKKLYHIYYSALQEFNAIKQERHRVERAIKHEMKKQNLTTHFVQQLNETILMTPSKTRIVIDSEDHVPLKYVSFFMKRQLDIKHIKEDLLQGKKIPGVRLTMDEAIECKAATKEPLT